VTPRGRSLLVGLCLGAGACDSGDGRGRLAPSPGGGGDAAGDDSTTVAGARNGGQAGTPSGGGHQAGHAGVVLAGASSGAAPSSGGSGGMVGMSGSGEGGEVSDGGVPGDAGDAGDPGDSSSPTATFSVATQLASDVKPTAPGTIGIVTFAVDVAPLAAARVDFGLDTNYGFTAPVDLTEPGYRTLLLGMKPLHSYHFRIVVSDGGATYSSPDYVIDTGPPTDLVPYRGFTIFDEAARTRGFMVMSYWSGDGRRVPFIVDADGEIVWWHASSVDGIARAAMSADGRSMWLIGAPLVRLGMDTLSEQVYEGTKGSHDITAVSGATMAYVEYPEGHCARVVEIDPSGTTRLIFDSETVLTLPTCHGNAIRYSAREDLYTFSDRRTDVFVLGRGGDVKWRLSDLVPRGNRAWGGGQHGHHLLPDSLLIFANWGVNNMASAAIEYDFAGQELRRFTSGAFSNVMGDAQRLPGGNTLLTFSDDSLIQEFDPRGDVVLEVDGGGSLFGYTSWRPSLYALASP